MANDEPYCTVEGCGRECQPTGPAFCPDHWQQLSKATRKYLKNEYAEGERYRWPDWMRKIFKDTVATIAKRLSA